MDKDLVSVTIIMYTMPIKSVLYYYFPVAVLALSGNFHLSGDIILYRAIKQSLPSRIFYMYFSWSGVPALVSGHGQKYL